MRRGHGIQWHGLAAERFRDRLAASSRDVDDVATSMREAAVKLDQLADALEERQAAIRQAMNWVTDMVEGAKRKLNSLAGEAADRLSDAERAVQEQARRVLSTASAAPHPGDPQWLDLARRLGR
ncbi:MAG TPA: hypothetical protein PLX68_10655 [Dermatophilaceae bacterium]|nr:hypothetical protein [Dermatophilaceae bacterium]